MWSGDDKYIERIRKGLIDETFKRPDKRISSNRLHEDRGKLARSRKTGDSSGVSPR
jgi:hypothetical protein